MAQYLGVATTAGLIPVGARCRRAQNEHHVWSNTKVLAELRSKTEISSSAKTQLKSTDLSRLV